MLPYLSDLLILASCVLAVVAVVQAFAARLRMPEATLLALAGIGFAACHVTLSAGAPEFARFALSTLTQTLLPAEAYLWLFLPPLLFQAALAVDVRNMLHDAAPILLLAIVAVFVATAVIGVSLAAFAPVGLVACLLLGAVVATTDPSAVLGIFHDVGAPGRLIRLVEGESLLNDAAAIALAATLSGMLVAGGSAHPDWWGSLVDLAAAFGGGVLLGLVAGRLVAFALPWMRQHAAAETALTMVLPYPLFLLGSQVLQVSGVVAVVCAALVINGLGRTRVSQRSWNHLQLVWSQIAAMAGAAVFLLAAMRVPYLLQDVTGPDIGYVLIAVVAALGARLLVLFLMLPALHRLQLSEPISYAYRFTMAWGGLRGAVTLVLALGIAEHTSLPPEVRRFVTVVATGFVLFSLLVNGSTLGWVMRRLGLNRLSEQDQALQRQAIDLSTEEISTAVRRLASAFQVSRKAAEEVTQVLQERIAVHTAALDREVVARDKLAIGLTALAARERDLIADYGGGVLSQRNLDAMMRATGDLIDATRLRGRVGYLREARRILRRTAGYQFAGMLQRRLGMTGPLATAVADRYELLMCRRAVLHRLHEYNQKRLQPLLGTRMAGVLAKILSARERAVGRAIDALHAEFDHYTQLLERRLLLLFALRRGRDAMQTMVDEQVITKEVHDWVRDELDRAWRIGVRRPPLPGKVQI